MSDLSILTLVRINNKDSNNELLYRYNEYKDDVDIVVDDARIKFIFAQINKCLEDKKTMPIKQWENYAKSFNLSNIQNYSDDITNIASSDFFSPFICDLIKNCVSFKAMYVAMFLANFIEFDENDTDLIETMESLTTNLFCAFQAVYILRKYKNYPRLHHDVYYTFTSQKNLNLVDFLIDYPDEFDQSLFYIFKNKLNYNYKVEPLKKLTLEQENEFKQLIDKHNHLLETYNQIYFCVKDFDEFFSKNNDIFALVEVFRKKIVSNFDNYKFILNFILNLLTRTNNVNCFTFALTCLDFFNYSKQLTRLYKIIEDISCYYFLTQYCLIVLRNTKNYQKKLRDLYSHRYYNTELAILSHMDLQDDENFLFLMENVEDPMIKNMFIFNIYVSYDLDNKINDLNLSDELINGIAKLFINLALLNLNMFEGRKNYDKLIIKFYENFYDKIQAKHFLNNTLYAYFYPLRNDKEKNVIDYISKKIIYEDELTYIDEQLYNSQMDVQEIEFLINFYQYFNHDQVLSLIKSNPRKYLKLISVFANDINTFDTCLDYLELEYKVNNAHLNTFAMNTDTHKKSTFKEIIELTNIASLLAFSSSTYHKFYEIGLKYFYFPIRLMFYSNVYKQLEQNNYIDDELIQIIETNQQHEQDENTIELIQKILSICKISIS